MAATTVDSVEHRPTHRLDHHGIVITPLQSRGLGGRVQPQGLPYCSKNWSNQPPSISGQTRRAKASSTHTKGPFVRSHLGW